MERPGLRCYPPTTSASSVFTGIMTMSMRRIRRRANATFSSGMGGHESSSSPRGELSRTVCCASDSFRSAPSVSSMVSTRSSTSTSSLPQGVRIQAWMFWAQRDGTHRSSQARTRLHESLPVQSFTKAFAVLQNEFLFLYRNDRKCSAGVEAPLVQIAVARAGRSIAGAFHVRDPHGEEMELHLYDRTNESIAQQWEEAFEAASDLTQAHLATFDLDVNKLSRNSMYRGSLYDLRNRKSGFRQTVKHKFRTLRSSRIFLPVIHDETKITMSR